VSLIFGSTDPRGDHPHRSHGPGRPKLPLVLVPGLMAAGIGSLVSIGMGAFPCLSTSAYALGSLPLPAFPRPDVADVGWSLLLAVGVAVGAFLVPARKLARAERVATPRPFLVLPPAVWSSAASRFAFSQLDRQGFGRGDVSPARTTWRPDLQRGDGSLGALALLIALKGIAWAISLGSYRGGPTFPAMFPRGGRPALMAAHLPGYELTPRPSQSASAPVSRRC